MKTTILYFIPVMLALTSCNNTQKTENTHMKTEKTDTVFFQNGYSDVNGIKMYYEIYGQGKPLVLLHGGGSTIQTTFGKMIPLLAKNRKLIAVELQAHGRTGDRNTPISFEQDAADVYELLKKLNIQKADIFGFSNGGNTAIQMAVSYPEICNKVIAGSPLLKKNGTYPQFWEFMKKGTFEQMPQQYKDAFLKVNADSTKLLNMFRKCADRMIHFKAFSDEQLKAIHIPVLLINGTEDVASPEHIVAMYRIIPGCKLAIIPGGHGEYMGEITTIKPSFKESDLVIPLIEKFLDEK
jgi:pimeloyl-ACP methyl ester carboxylesterase